MLIREANPSSNLYLHMPPNTTPTALTECTRQRTTLPLPSYSSRTDTRRTTSGTSCYPCLWSQLTGQERPIPRNLHNARLRADHRDRQNPRRRALLRRRKRCPQHHQARQCLDLLSLRGDHHLTHRGRGARLPGDS